jgi:hypothetical protein
MKLAGLLKGATQPELHTVTAAGYKIALLSVI